MSLLLEALKTLADRPVPTDVSATAAPGEQTQCKPTGSIPPAENRPVTEENAQSGVPPEKLLDDADSLVADSLDEAADTSSQDEQAVEILGQLESPEETLSPVDSGADVNWTETWQQALGVVSSDATPAKDVSGEATPEESEGEENLADPEMGEKLNSIFAPWFAAHGLATEPVEEEIQEPEPSAHEEPAIPAEEIPMKLDEATESASTEVPAAPQQDEDNAFDPTWELYDRSSEFTTPWGVESKDSLGPQNKAESKPTADSHPSSIQPEYAADAQNDLEAPSSKSLHPKKSPTAFPIAPHTQVEEQQTERSDWASQTSAVTAPVEPIPKTVRKASQPAPPATEEPDEIRVSEPYLRLANRLLQSLRNARPQAIVLAAADDASSRTLDMAQLAKAILLSEEGKLLLIQAHEGRPDLSRRLGLLPEQHPRWQAVAGSDLSERIHCSSQGRIDMLPREKLCLNSEQLVDPLLIARCKRHYPLVLIDVGVVASEIARGLAPQADVAVLVAVMQNTPREIAAQSILLLRRLGVRTAGCVLLEPRPENSTKLR